MTIRTPFRMTRRRILVLGLSLPLPAFLAACSDGETEPEPTSPAAGGNGAAPSTTRAPAATASSTAQPQLTATPECGDDDDFTIAQTEGPYFTPNSPERASLLETGITGTRLTITGFVLSTNCTPVARALVDFWQCDGAGVYDNSGFKLRGHQFTDANGRYQLTTIVPGVYPGRTRHIHVKVQAPNRPVLTTQLYFPNEPANARDGIYNAALVLDEYADAANGAKAGAFNFVLNV